MPTPRVLAGNIEVGLSSSSLVSVIDTVHAVLIDSQLTQIAVPPTPDDPEQTYRAGSLATSVTFAYTGDIPDQLADLLWTAQRSSSTSGGRQRGELYFRATRYPGAVSASNPRFGGWLLATQARYGGQGGEFEEHTVTLPASRGVDKL